MLHALLSNREKGTMGDNFPAVWQYWLIFDVVAQMGTQRNKVLMSNGWIKSLLRSGTVDLEQGLFLT